jgi:hypothetical protein
MIYFVSELLFFLALLVFLFLLGTCAVILFILVHECGRWSVRKFREVTKPMVSGRGWSRFLGFVETDRES